MTRVSQEEKELTGLQSDVTDRTTHKLQRRVSTSDQVLMRNEAYHTKLKSCSFCAVINSVLVFVMKPSGLHLVIDDMKYIKKHQLACWLWYLIV